MTIILIIITVVISIAAFNSEQIMNALRFNACKVYHKKEWHRLITHAFVHGNYEHLIINMIVFFSFGDAMEHFFKLNYGSQGVIYYLLLYFGSVLFSCVYSLFRHKDNYYYNAVGASGAVSAILFASIFIDPWRKLLLFFVLPIPGIVFALAYLGYSYYMAKKQSDNIGHDAHFLGALFGFVFPMFIDSRLFTMFIDKLFLIV